jgi:RimJ/RimL family protein N-acetyltransferase
VKGKAMTKGDGIGAVTDQNHKQMLKLVAKGFYNELINYGVNKGEVVSVASHLLDNLLQNGASNNQPVDCYSRFFTIKDVKNDWSTSRRLSLHEVSIRPIDLRRVGEVAAWLQAPAIQESFYPRFPRRERELEAYFESIERQYFTIDYQGRAVGIIGGENIDTQAAKLEMRKLVGDPRLRGKGIGKRATFLFLYHAFLIRNVNKVYIHSMDTNIRNLNLNGKFGFELEGVFLEEAVVENGRRDVVRMALTRPSWLKLFSEAVIPKQAQ